MTCRSLPLPAVIVITAGASSTGALAGTAAAGADAGVGLGGVGFDGVEVAAVAAATAGLLGVAAAVGGWWSMFSFAALYPPERVKTLAGSQADDGVAAVAVAVAALVGVASPGDATEYAERLGKNIEFGRKDVLA